MDSGGNKKKLNLLERIFLYVMIDYIITFGRVRDTTQFLSNSWALHWYNGLGHFCPFTALP